MVLEETKPLSKARVGKGENRVAFPQDYIVLDLETTGLSSDHDEIIEVSALKVHCGKIIDRYETLIHPLQEIPSFISDLTGITNDMVLNAPYFSDILSELIDFIGNLYIVGHNVNFDINFLYDSLMNAAGVPLMNDYIDTLRISRKLYPNMQHHKLINLIEYLDIVPDGNLHRASQDTYCTLQCFLKMQEDVSNRFKNPSDFFALFKKRYAWANKIDSRLITAEVTEFDTSHPLYGKTCVFTGTLDRISRREAMQLVANLGGCLGNGVTRKTDYLILGNNDYCTTIKDGKSTKQKKAEELILKGFDIQIMPEDVFYDLVNDYLDDSDCTPVQIIKASISKSSFYTKYKPRFSSRDIIPDVSKFDPQNPLYKKKICFTGSLKKFTRQEAMQSVADVGGKCLNNVTKCTDFLVVGDYSEYSTIAEGNYDKTYKHRIAEEYQSQGISIKIISEDEFCSLLFYSDKR